MNNGKAEPIADFTEPLRDPSGNTFVIEADGKWHVAVSVLEFDPQRAVSAEDRGVIDQVAGMFREANDHMPAVKLVQRRLAVAQATSPSPPPPPPPPDPPPPPPAPPPPYPSRTD